ncbi:MAG: glutamate 5-kinase [Myxococcales bacterium]|nr:glutamate 5-kinase [Myxococcales bacterium]
MKVVVKIGSAVLMRDGSNLDRGAFCRLVDELAAVVHEGHQLVVVTSGAVAAGRRQLGLAKRPTGERNIPILQALAAFGQSRLIQLYDSEFSHYDIHVAQLLLTRDDFNNRQRYLNARNTLTAVHNFGALPIINENDTVATDEIRFGDNDQLAALVATMTGSDLLVLLSDIDGLYSANPQIDPDARRFDVVRAMDASLDDMVGDIHSATRDGSGGMRTKLLAARIAARVGIQTVIAPGKQPNVVADVLAGRQGVGTRFMPDRDADKLDARKAWIGLGVQPAGRLVCDPGAVRAVCERGKSLLPSGVRAVEGDFTEGDVVELVTDEGQPFARGLVAYPSVDAQRIVGLQSDAIEAELGYKIIDALVHRNDLMILG